MLGLATAAFAVTGEFNDMCTEGLANSKQVKTDYSVNANIKGKTFSNEQAKAEFLKNPDANLAKAQAFYSKSHQG